MTPEQEQRVEELFQRAADLAGHARSAFLNDHCDGNGDIRAKLDRLLGLHDSGVDTLLKAPVFSPSSGLASQTETELPKRIGHYEIVGVVGEGGMGTVYEARQENPSRTVALKVIRSGFASAQMLKRFRYEAHILGQLQHDGIAQIYEAGVADVVTNGNDHDPLGRRPFFAMEFVRGRPLTKYVDDRRLPTRRRMELMASICDAVQHAHGKGVIHRDLKPANVLVSEDGRAKVLDFGVARVTDADMQTLTTDSSAGQLIGTVPYMSPEQVVGDSRQLDTRSDVYSLGVVLYEVLAGRLPLDVRHRSIPEAARVIREEEPSRLSSISTAFRGDIETIVAKALDKDRERRYQSASELSGDIRRYLADEPIVARPASRMYQFRKFARRNRALVGGLVATFVVLVGGIVATSMQAVRATRAETEALKLAGSEAAEKAAAQTARADAETARTEAERQAERSLANYEFLLWGFGFANESRPGTEDLTLRQMLNLASEHIGDRFEGRPEAEAAVRTFIGQAYSAIADDERAISQLTLAYELGERLPHFNPEELANIALSLSLAEREAQHGEEAAQRWLAKYEAITRQLIRESYPMLGGVVDDMHDALADGKRHSDEAINRHLDAVLDAYVRAMPADHPDGRHVAGVISTIATYLNNNYGSTDGTRRSWAESLAILQRILPADRELGPREQRWYCIALWLVAGSEAPEGEEDRRVAVARELVEAQQYMPVEHFFFADGRARLGEALMQRGHPGDFEEAEQLMLSSYETIAKSRGRDHFRTAIAVRRIIRMYIKLEKWDRAAEFLANPDSTWPYGWENVRSLFEARYPKLAEALVRLDEATRKGGNGGVDAWSDVQSARRDAFALDEPIAVAYADVIMLWAQRPPGDSKDLAESMYRQALDIYGEQLPPDHRKIGSAHSELGYRLGVRGEFVEAIEHLRRGLEILESIPLTDPWPIANLQRILGTALLDSGDHDAAELMLLAAYAFFDAYYGAEHIVPLRGKPQYLSWTLNSLIELHTVRGEPERARPFRRQLAEQLATSTFLTMASARNAFEPDDAELVEAMELLERRIRERSEAVGDAIDHCVETRRRLLTDDDPRSGVVASLLLSSLDRFAGNGGSQELTSRMLDEADSICRASADIQSEKYSILLWWAANIHLSRKEFEAGESAARECLRLNLEIFGDEYRATAHARSMLGAVLAGRRQYEEAEPLLVEGYRGLAATDGVGKRSTNTAFLRTIEMYTAWGRMDEAARFAAIELESRVGRAANAAGPLNSVVWFVVRVPGLESALYEKALTCAEQAVSLEPNTAGYLNTLGVAQYRAGRYEAALETLAKSDRAHMASNRPAQPADWAFLTMAHHQMGHEDDAGEAMERLRGLMSDPVNAGSAENQAFLREAQNLLGSV